MKVVVQRVSSAQVTIDAKVVGKISRGLMVLIGITHDDTQVDADKLVSKLINLRLFPSEKSEFDFSIIDTKAEVLVVSQFTLYGSTAKGRRPDFFDAAKPEIAKPLCDYFVEQLRQNDVKVETGVFGADMQVELVNDGPVTLIIESK